MESYEYDYGDNNSWWENAYANQTNYDELLFGGNSTWMENRFMNHSNDEELFPITEVRNVETEFEDPVSGLGSFAIIIPTFSAIVGLIGLIGNLLVIFVIIANRQMRTTTNMLIVNLTIVDLLYIFGCLPFWATTYVTEKWVFGLMACKVFLSLIYVTPFVKVYTLVFMAMDRVLVTICPVASRTFRTKGKFKILIGLLWTTTLLLAIGASFLFDIHTYSFPKQGKIEICHFSAHNNFVSFNDIIITNLFLIYVIPTVLISTFLISTFIKLCCFKNISSNEYHKDHVVATKMTAVLLITFVLLTFPHWLIVELSKYVELSENFIIFTIIAQMLHFINFCVNPLIYGLMSLNFRGAFKKALQCSTQYQLHTNNTPTYRREPSNIGTCSTVI